jgi:uncharacterized damage-inducible protein DinB
MNSTLAHPAFLELAEHSLLSHHLPRIVRCLQILSIEQIWWRPNAASNSVGNLALHLTGNVRQWIISGLGREPDTRRRAVEFSARGPVPRARLLRQLNNAVVKACGVLRKLSAQELERAYTIQGLPVSGLQAVHHVVEHFAFHTGQIVFITKQVTGRDLQFTRLPGEKHSRERGLPVL